MSNIRRNVKLLLVDPQDDFANPKGSLYVSGAEKAMERVAAMIDRVGDKLDQILCSMDSHAVLHIGNTTFWKDSKGNNPPPFTQITAKDVREGVWVPVVASWYNRALKYLEDLEAAKRSDGTSRYIHTAWPPHCIIGEKGWTVYEPVANALHRWQLRNYSTVDYVTKGSNFWTEHFSVVKAEVPNSDPGTMVNSKFLEDLQEADQVVAAGIAGDVCFANTLRDLYDLFKDKTTISKFVLLTDALPSISDDRLNAFLDEMKSLGVKTSTTVDFLA